MSSRVTALLDIARRRETGASSRHLWGIVVRSGREPTARSHYSSAARRRGDAPRWPPLKPGPGGAGGALGRLALRRALERLGQVIAPERLLVVLLRREVPELAPELEAFGARHVVQPAWRGSAAEAFLAAIRITREDPHATIALLPWDHLADGGTTVMRYVTRAASAVEVRPDLAVVIGAPHHGGVLPSAWIEPGGPVERLEGFGIRAVARFMPYVAPAERAALVEGGALSATRVIVGRVATLVAAGRAQLPEVLETLEPLEAAADHERDLLCEAVYECMPRADLVTAVPPRGEGFAVLPIPEFLELPASPMLLAS